MYAKHSFRRANQTPQSNAPIKPAHSNAPQSGSNFIYTKIAGRAAIGLYLHKDFEGGDATENGDFPIRKQRLQWYKKYFVGFSMGAL